MKLIGATSSPYVRKVRIVMAEKKLDYQLVLEDVWADDTAIAHSNPLGKVPCLVMEGGEALFDSRVIVEYLDTLSPVGKLIPAVGRERAEVKTWEALADGVLDALVLARLERHWGGRKDGERSQAWIERQLRKTDTSLKAMSQGLADKPFCAGIHLTLADVAVGCALGYLDFRFPEIAWRADHPNLAKLYDKLSQRPSFQDSQPA
ncbi:glutathione S-transferase family protein [Ramlibacter rhizophilus]|uniref:Glutathione S-transferase n=1 Tax=Ramlibacter rhizophilus TaxID=1781167 RepID=A0A4Z0BJ09_9BURK|nr:glutathione S-transferase N-terminal domain-containing protein [Ramlibacter rhizophilus]TFY97888.1 glutathione S-transferase [Ramlibacter rhizophilus]